MKKLLLAGLVLVMCSCNKGADSSNPILNIAGGQVQGIPADSSETIIYKGIPYAAPPVGELRWRRPQPVVPWDGVLVADSFGAASVQADQTPGSFYEKEFFWQGDPVRSEDCLYLNVWTPADAAGKPDKNLPVAMWIHGGAYTGGYGHEVEMDGEAWAEKGVILVTINYRLGLLGFLTHPLLGAEEPDGVSGNYGTWDQAAALKWVKDNIAAFGGDPNNIMVFGQSAGAASVKNMVTSPMSKGLLSKAVIQSIGGLGDLLRGGGYEESAAAGKAVMDAAGYTTLEQMRAATPAQLTTAVAEYSRTAGRYVSFGPVVDGHLLPENFTEATYNNHISDVPYMIGYNADDFGAMGSGIAEFCLVRDSLSSKPSYSYFFERRLPGDDSGAFHSAELWYVFGTLSKSWRPFTAGDYRLSEQMVTCWTNFAKYGDPNGSTPGEWSPYTEQTPYVMVFDVK